MKEKSRRNPRPVMLSKRANVFYLEHVRVLQMDDRLVFATQDEGELERFFNLPERNTAFILLGKGSSITDAAARRGWLGPMLWWAFAAPAVRPCSVPW